MNYKYKINEIFYSIQGEGRFTGTPAIFIRFSGCNLHCPFCDTDFQSYTEYTKSELEKEVENICKDLKEKPIIVFTGGEPSLQLTQEEELLKDFHRSCETNGIIELPTWLNWITCSPKTDIEIYDRVNEIKVLMIDKRLSYIEKIYNKYKDKKLFYIQPLETDGNMNIEETINWLLKHPKAKLSLQIHKIIGVR